MQSVSMGELIVLKLIFKSSLIGPSTIIKDKNEQVTPIPQKQIPVHEVLRYAGVDGWLQIYCFLYSG